MDFNKMYESLSLWVSVNGPKFLFAIILFFVGQWLIRIINRTLRKSMRSKKMDASLRPFLMSLISAALQILLVLGIMQILGIRMTIFAAIIGAFGVAAGLALSGTLQNFTSGILILILKPYRVGDIIVSQGQEGVVCAINIFNTVMLTYDNKTVIIPNSKLSNEVIINLSREGKRRIDIEMKFNYGFDFEELKAAISEILLQQSVIVNDPPIRVGMMSIEPDGFKIFVNAWVNAHGYVDNKMLIQQAIINGLKRKGYKLPGMP